MGLRFAEQSANITHRTQSTEHWAEPQTTHRSERRTFHEWIQIRNEHRLLMPLSIAPDRCPLTQTPVQSPNRRSPIRLSVSVWKFSVFAPASLCGRPLFESVLPARAEQSGALSGCFRFVYRRARSSLSFLWCHRPNTFVYGWAKGKAGKSSTWKLKCAERTCLTSERTESREGCSNRRG